MRDRAQAYTLEGIIAAILVASALVLGLQAVDIQPWADEGPEQGDELRVQVEDALAIADDTGALRKAVTCVTEENGTYVPDERAASTIEEGTALGAVLNDTLSEGASYTIQVAYEDGGELQRQPLTPVQAPLSSSVLVTRQLTLYESDDVLEFDGEACSPGFDTLGDRTDELYLGEPADGELYTVVRVEVRAW